MPDNESRIVRLGDRTPPSRKNQMAGHPTTQQVMQWIEAGSIAGMKQVYAQLTDENAKMFQQLEDLCTQRVLAELEARSLRGRLRHWWRRVRRLPAIAKPDGREVALGMLRDRLQSAKSGEVVALPWGTGPQDAQRIAKELGTDATGVTL